MRHRIEQARAELRTAELALGDTRLTAPATGVVVERRVEPGDLAVPGQTLLVLDDPRVYRLEAEVGESAMGHVRLRQPVAGRARRARADAGGPRGRDRSRRPTRRAGR